MPPQLKIINDKLFKNCTNLSSISIQSKVIVIGKSAFENCSNLSSLSLPDSVKTIKTNAFYKSSSLSSLNVPSLLESVEFNSFVNGLSSILQSFKGKGKIPDDYMKQAIKNILCISLEAGLSKIKYQLSIRKNHF